MWECREKSRKTSFPIWAWANVFSLDAVLAGLMWHYVFTMQFCERSPDFYEYAIIGLSIWLVYTADRLFDSLRLDISRPHSMRHRFHYEYRTGLWFSWLAALLVDTTLIVCYASETQLRWGCAAIAMVICYVAGVHCAPKMNSWLPKELQVGLVFSFGVALTAWSEIEIGSVVPLLISTLMAALLFAANCLVIANWECQMDLSQNFRSFALRFPVTMKRLPLAIVLHSIAALLLFYAHFLPAMVFGCMIASNALLSILCLANRDIRSPGRHGIPQHASALVPLADVALVLPPLACAAARGMMP